ncbi:SDR family oxidoreductase [Lactobacillus sp. CBA3606]|uniref:SDR family oxidoreductase n=1 Tax=Lactobacillus sp. CBA3606 TaxID=2099789 RepID=UPI000CFB6DD3|nr:SDR family oxidoreductase [Lactobacillus sp. CBA3606]AVK64185.1 SDR family oxidoreductase [Lactobacillus sp. CBA3606]
MSVENKVVVVTGASSGIGAATVKLLVNQGAKVVFGARRADKLAMVAADLPKDQIAYQVTDVAELVSVQELIHLAVSTFGKIDALFNNAGVMPTANLAENHHDEWQRMLDINVMGVLNGISAVLPVMHQQGFGHILATDSVAGHLVYPGSAVYCGTKFAVRAIMEGLRQEEIQNRIRTTIVSPGAVDTELYRSISDSKTAKDLVTAWHATSDSALQPEDLAAAVVYAIGAPSRVAVNEVLIRPAGQAM